MIKFLKKDRGASIATDKTTTGKAKSTDELIEEIHETFYTEVDRLLASAKIAHSLETDKHGLIEKSERLKALGFSSSKEVIEADAEIKRLEELKRENDTKTNLIEAINYFSFKYPNFKFITEESVLKICEKYGLVYGEISRYTGVVPEENLKHIENFRVLEDDECYVNSFSYDFSNTRKDYYKNYITFERYKEKEAINKNKIYTDPMSALLEARDRRELNMKCPLEIAAPLGDFDMKGAELKNFKISNVPVKIPDPVVLKPVIFGNQKYYLIVTAWGKEASDEIVVNSKFN